MQVQGGSLAFTGPSLVAVQLVAAAAMLGAGMPLTSYLATRKRWKHLR